MNNIDRFAKHLEAHICPLTGQPCKAGSPAECEHFWNCIRKALEVRQASGKTPQNPPQSPPPALGDASAR